LKSSKHFWFEAYVSEFVGTFFLVLTVGVNVLQNTALAPVSIGCMLTAMIFATAGVGGVAHLNPAVTLGFMLGRECGVGTKQALMLVLGQILGGMGGSYMYAAILGVTFTLQPGQGFTAKEAFAVEFLFSAVLVFVVLHVAPRWGKDISGQYFGLAIGAVVMAAAFAVGHVSGCSLNPALALGVMSSHWLHTGTGLYYAPLYLLAPLIGGCLASAAHRALQVGSMDRAVGSMDHGSGVDVQI